MKRVFLTVAMAALVGCGMEVCAQQSVTKTDLTGFSRMDSLAYAIGQMQCQGLQEYVEGNWGVDFSKNREAFIQGMRSAVNVKKGSAEYARFVGFLIGEQVVESMLPGINKAVFGEDSTKTFSSTLIMKGMADVLNGQTAFEGDAAQEYAEGGMEALKREILLAKYGANKKAGEDFLKAMAKKRGVKKLEGGVLYKVIENYREGAHPSPEDRVTLHYEGRTIDGEVFDSSFDGEPVKLDLENVVEGFRTAVVNMRVGSTWEVYIPQELAYGEREIDGIDPFSTLIFKINLQSIVIGDDDEDLDIDEIDDEVDDEVDEEEIEGVEE